MNHHIQVLFAYIATCTKRKNSSVVCGIRRSCSEEQKPKKSKTRSHTKPERSPLLSTGPGYKNLTKKKQKGIVYGQVLRNQEYLCWQIREKERMGQSKVFLVGNQQQKKSSNKY
ncbi:772_t:CDS:1 [Gigaspora margarita]|uniref:772_t:CDS:1 n=1 Tax=Gigaspora margarita TaxID=4874 RepID=A0ABN7VQ26_GIGMA|nr:772_t:CDS:1 [Gigaspora margarita]